MEEKLGRAHLTTSVRCLNNILTKYTNYVFQHVKECLNLPRISSALADGTAKLRDGGDVCSTPPVSRAAILGAYFASVGLHM